MQHDAIFHLIIYGQCDIFITMSKLMPLKIDAVKVMAICRRKGLTQQRIAADGGVAPRTVADISLAARCIEEGRPEDAPKLDVRLSTVSGVAKGLGVRALEILIDLIDAPEPTLPARADGDVVAAA